MIHRLELKTIWGHYHLEPRKVTLYTIIMINDLRSFTYHWIIFATMFVSYF
jgi:hypothetical protein